MCIASSVLVRGTVRWTCIIRRWSHNKRYPIWCAVQSLDKLAVFVWWNICICTPNIPVWDVPLTHLIFSTFRFTIETNHIRLIFFAFLLGFFNSNAMENRINLHRMTEMLIRRKFLISKIFTVHESKACWSEYNLIHAQYWNQDGNLLTKELETITIQWDSSS